VLKNACSSCLAILAFLLPIPIHSQAPASVFGCPATFVKVDRPDFSGGWKFSARVRNTSQKKIVGMTFNAAVADATESWVWIPEGSRIAEFDWNRELKPGQSKELSWYLRDNYVATSYLNQTIYFNETYYHEHSSGGAIVLTGVLFADGSSWEGPSNRESCMGLWYNPHKKAFVKPIQLLARQ
jgi:hypothetical protein